MKHVTNHLNVDGVDLYRNRAHGEVVIRFITPTEAYDVPLLSHHAAALATALMETAS